MNKNKRLKIGLFIDTDDESFESLINTNLLAPMYLSKYALNYMISKRLSYIKCLIIQILF